MDKAKQKLLEQTHQTILKVGFEDNDYKLVADLISTNFVGFGTALDEKIFGIKDLKALLKRQKEQSKGIDMNVALRTLHTHFSENENTAVYIDEGVLSITTGEDSIEMTLRLSMVLEYIENKWLMVHFHSSKPEEVESEKDTWGIETWKEKAEALEKEVAERTADLVLKNRDLEIEAALERVRARSMAMHSSDELNQVVSVLFENLKELQIPVTAAGIQIYLEDSEDMLNYVCGENSEGLVISHYRMPYFDNAIINDFKNARDSKDEFFVGNYSKKVKDSFYNYLFANTEIKDVPEDIKQMIFDSRAYTISMAPVSNSLIAINDFQGNELSENHVEIIKRFAKMFEQAYIRFRDLQKAEAQAREAQIQLSLERVRAKSMAMQSSDELHDVIGVVFQQFDNLKIQPVNVFLSLFDREKRLLTYRASGKSGNRMPTKQTVDIDSVDAWSDLYNKWINDSSDDIEVIYYPKEIVPDILNLLKDTFLAMPKRDRMTVKDFPEGGYSTLGYTPFGYIGYDHTRPPTEEEKDILKRICTEFGRVYQRFLDLKKAEAQAREAQIEAALEKVRSRSMAMHNSQELKEVALELRKQMGLLGQKDLEVCAIHLYGNDEDSFESWSAMKASGSETEIVQTQAHFPKRGIRIVDEMVHHYTIGTKDYILVNEGEKIAEWFKVLKKHAPELHSSILDSIGKVPVKQLKANWAVADFSGGALVMVIYGEPDEVSRNLLRRSANVFEQAYVRFLDLQKAEAQAREAQIETALEKVRSRSMGMQKSTELLEVITVVSQQLQTLGFRFSHVSFINNSLKEQNSFWVAATGLPNPMRFIIPYKAMPMIDNLRKAQKNKDAFYTNVSTIKEHQEWFKHLLKHSGENVFPKEIIDYQMSKGLARSISIHTNIMLALANTQSEPYSDYENKIIARFGQVFEQSYTRFLDLQRAEAQVKEAQIEAALERVRSRSMGMQKSEELEEIIQVVFDQFIQLGITVDHSGFIMDYKSRDDMHIWLADQHKITSQITLPYFDSPHWNSYNEAKKKGDNLFLNHLNFKEKNKFYKQIFKYVPELPEDAKTFYLQCPSLTIATTLADNIGLYIENYSGIQYSEEDQKTLIRFGKVFQQTYTRFLDLTKAEAQAREAKIEAALERVRARTMGMHKSDELGEVAALLFEQISILSKTPNRFNIGIVDPESESINFWVTEHTGKSIDREFVAEAKKSIVMKKMIESWRSKTARNIQILKGQALEKWLNYIGKAVGVPIEKKRIGKTRYLSSIYFKHGLLGITTNEPVAEEILKILERFSKVFEQTYTRFLDLQNSEAQAREANIQLALERVRASTMAMKTQGDLLDVIDVFGSQLTSLGIDVDTVSVIHGVPKRDWDLWLHTPNSGVPPFRVHVPYIDTAFFSKSIKNIEEYERTGNPIHFKAFNKEEKDEFLTHYFNHAPPIPEEFKTVAFAQNQCYVIEAFLEEVTVTLLTYGLENFSEEDIKIFTRFSLEFKQTYTRFLDLQKAEDQARQAQIEVSLERVRSRAMAMHQTDELTDVLCVLFDQFDILGINPVLTHLTLFDEENQTFSLRITTTAENRIVAEQYIDVNAIEAWKDSFENWKKSEPNAIDCIDYEPEVIPMVWELLSEVMNALPKGHKIYPEDFPDGLYTTQGHFKFGYIGFNHSRRATEEEKDIVVRFAKEFGRTYQRFLDIEKAEVQAREAQIEAALEKVRSRSLGMQQSNEMQQVANEVHQQLRNLGVDIDAMAMSGVIDNESDYDVWVGGEDYDKPLRIPYNNDTKVQRDYNKAIKERPEHFTKTYKGKTKDAYFEHLMATNAFNPKLKKMMLECSAFTTTLTFMKNSGMQIIRYNDNTFSDEDNSIVKRFGRVFEQAYIRFLDLQKAEAQAREAQIEMSLEKVRSRTMAMQTSSELPEAANTLFLEVQALGIPAWSAGYCIWQDDKHNAKCNMSSEGEIQKGFVLPSIGEGYDFYTPQENGERFYVKELGGEALVKHYEFMKQLPNVGEIFKELIDAGLELPTFQIFHIVYFKFGYVMFITYEKVPEAHDIFKRFGQVFEQTYTRFLDLERAEAQAREARIEMALEKVRSRTMAMQKSDELQDAAQVLFNEIRGLGIPSWSCGYNILSDDKKSAECWMSSEGALQKPFTLYYEKEKSFIEQYDFFKSKKNFLVQEQKGRDLVEAYEYMKTIPKIGEIIVDLEESGISLPTHQFNHLCKFNKGYLLFITYEPVPEAHELFVRFTKVFEQTYTRFLDLKQAEARAREAQIQSALERVRSHSMGMQSTADFANVTTEMFNQLRNFGEDLFATGIVFCDKHEGHVEQWHSIPGAGMLSPMIVPIDLDYIHQYRYDQWKTGTTLFSIEIPSDFIEQHFEAIFKLPSAQITLKDLESRNAPMPAPPAWEIDYGASFKHGYILVSSLKPVENMDILPRFAQVFEQAYIRFLDLQKAEAQARESQIEAALEKVRSRTLAMQKSDELADTSVVVFKELLELGIEPNRLFIGIVKDNGNAIEAWATNEDGSKIEQHFKLYTSKNKSIKKMVDGWKQQKKSAIIDMQGKELQEYFHYLNKVMQIPFIHGLKQKRRVQSIAYFSGGLIGMAAPEEQPEETINLLERFAAVFNLTYTRFNDLKIAEAQAEQAEEDLINLQKAKKNAEEALAELQTTQKQLIQSEKMASLGELTAGIAHEIQNPLNFVNNFSEVSKELLDEMLEEIENGDMEEVKAIMTDVIENLEKINHHGKRADGIVKGMLQHSRASGDKKEATDINALADEYLRLAYHGLRAKDKSFNAQLVTDFDESIGKVRIIPQDIGRVVLNLLTNAFYAVNEKNKMGIDNYEPTVAVRTKKIKDNIEIEVTDNGNGMPDSVKQKIFQPFFTTKPPGQGTGLGLSMSYDIITKGHGGELKVETKEGKGTIFILELPL